MSERILRLDKAGTPVEWLDWQMAATLYARGLVTWTLGDVIFQLHGGTSRLTGTRSCLSLHSIIACDGVTHNHRRPAPPLTSAFIVANRFLKMCSPVIISCPLRGGAGTAG